MAEFEYKAARRDGSIARGRVSVASLDLAARQLRAQGLTPINLVPASAAAAAVPLTGGAGLQSSKKGSGKRTTRDQVLSITSELSVLLRAGLPIDRALKVLIDMSPQDQSREMLEDLLRTVKGGKGLSQAMEPYQDLFGGFYISMVRSGEASGRLSEVLARLAEYLESAKEVRSSVISALIYPAILVVVAVLSIFVMLGYVVPQFEALFADLGDGLPLLTRGVIAVGEGLKSWGWVLIILAALAVWLARRWLAQPEGKAWLDSRLLRLPLLGTVVFKYEVARFARTMGTLLKNGVSLLQSLSIASGTVSNVHVQAALSGLAPTVKQGGRISVALEEAKTFSPMMVQIIRVGEESGQLDEMMLELAKVYDNEVKAGIKRSLTLLEPVLILSMAGVIALIIIAILMGILSVNDLAI